MGRRRKEPRLYLDTKRRQWAIRDGEEFIRTGCDEHQTEKAALRLQRHLNRTKARWQRTIYFVTCDVPDFPIKIGISNNLPERLRDIRTSLPYPVILLGSTSGTSLDEIAIQKRFVRLRLNGEWFRRDEELTSYIDQFRSVLVPIECRVVPEGEVERCLTL